MSTNIIRKTLITNGITGQKKVVANERINTRFIKKLFKIDIDDDKIIFQIQDPQFKEYIDFNLDQDWVEICGKQDLIKLKFFLRNEKITDNVMVKKNIKHSIAASSKHAPALKHSPSSSAISTMKFLHNELRRSPRFQQKNSVHQQLTDGNCTKIKSQINQTPLLRRSPQKSLCNVKKQLFINTTPSTSKLYTSFTIDEDELEIFPILQSDLKMKKVLTKGPKGDLLTVIRKKLKLNNQDDLAGYRCAANFVFNEYPFILDVTSDEFVGSIIQSLKDKKANESRRLKAAVSSNKPPSNSEGIYKSKYGFPCYSTNELLNESEQKESIEMLIAEFHASPKKNTENTISKLMNETYGIRRQIVNSQNTTVNLIREKFPTLFSCKQFIAEANRLMGIQVVDVKTIDSLKRFSKLLPREVLKTVQSLYRNEFEGMFAIANIKTIDKQNELMMLGRIALALHENPLLIYSYDISNIQSGYPYIVLIGQGGNLVVNGETVLKDINCIEMALIWAVSFPILHLQVPSKVQKTYSFLLHALLKWKPTAKRTPLSILKLLTSYTDCKTESLGVDLKMSEEPVHFNVNEEDSTIEIIKEDVPMLT